MMIGCFLLIWIFLEFFQELRALSTLESHNAQRARLQRPVLRQTVSRTQARADYTYIDFGFMFYSCTRQMARKAIAIFHLMRFYDVIVHEATE
jgi:hypothetical protein